MHLRDRKIHIRHLDQHSDLIKIRFDTPSVYYEHQEIPGCDSEGALLGIHSHVVFYEDNESFCDVLHIGILVF